MFCTVFLRFILLFQNIVVFLRYKFEAIHNKDYSVVKTSRAGLVSFFFVRNRNKTM